ncbi:MAG TPA: BlaI/MecI/CopY family transcriptional regulator [Gemmatales bacterium]|nr:BlaI/MecI/CopY family transcriptional regulator [Gemmatales bacterium]HMP16414.1 BlaI/MecI/CopY family transcriptional regulator [Gemmatales bacterium]
MVHQPTPRELEILKALWDQGPSGVREVYQVLAEAQEEDLAYNTVQTLLRIMEEKGLVKHHVEGRAFIYTPLYSREESVSGFVDRVFNGAASEMVATLINDEKLPVKELERIQLLINEARRRKG